jgi:peptidoglycan hydrolase-like protein with peptidoglycan-binding domain
LKGNLSNRQALDVQGTQTRSDRTLSRDEVRELQTLPLKKGFNDGTPDGVIGPETQSAAQAFARTHQMKITQGSPSLRLVDAVRGH